MLIFTIGPHCWTLVPETLGRTTKQNDIDPTMGERSVSEMRKERKGEEGNSPSSKRRDMTDLNPLLTTSVRTPTVSTTV